MSPLFRREIAIGGSHYLKWSVDFVCVKQRYDRKTHLPNNWSAVYWYYNIIKINEISSDYLLITKISIDFLWGLRVVCDLEARCKWCQRYDLGLTGCDRIRVRLNILCELKFHVRLGRIQTYWPLPWLPPARRNLP